VVGMRAWQLASEDVTVFLLGLMVLAALGQNPGGLMPGFQHVGVIGPQHSLPHGEDIPELLLRLVKLALVRQNPGDLMPGFQRASAREHQPAVDPDA
jgi:hypothetical protein